MAPGSIWNLPHHRRPKGMGRGSSGPVGDYVFALEPLVVERNGLVLRADPIAPDIHAFVEPAARIVLEQYETRLLETRPSWAKVWP